MLENESAQYAKARIAVNKLSMPQPSTQLNGKRSCRGRLSEGRPTKKTPQLIARIAKAISLGLTDEETSALVGIDPNTLMNWKKDPEFLGAIKSAVAARLVKRLDRIESGTNGWQGPAWLMERLMPSRYAKPEVQILLNSFFHPTNNSPTLTLSLEEAQRLSRESERDVEVARKLISVALNGISAITLDLVPSPDPSFNVSPGSTLTTQLQPNVQDAQ